MLQYGEFYLRMEVLVGSRAMKGKSRFGVRKKNKKSIVLSVLAVIVALVAAAVIGVFALCQSWLQDLPDYTNADAYAVSKPSVVYASDGTTVLAEFQLENRDPVEFDQVCDYVKKGTVATEDERFYEHNGVDLMGIARALVNNLMGGDLEGASTITQQFVRNTILADEMTDISFKRKIREMYISLELEKMYSKDEILLMYLNTINYGNGTYGIEAASERYFSKHASELTLAEAATLIGIPQSPTYNEPINHPDQCIARRNLVLDRMVSNGVISQEEADAAKAEELVLNETIPSTTGILAYPYFTSYVRNQLTDPDGKYAYSRSDIWEGGLSIYTTLDVNTQKAAEEAAAKKIEQAGDIYEVAMVAIDPDNGYIRAMVGGKDYLGVSYDENQGNMATGEGTGGRQPGSSFKAFTLIAALEAGINPDTMIDAGYSVEVPGSQDVHNAGMADYGTRSIASAFAVSSNTAFMRLIMSVGVDNVIEVAHRMGITSELPEVAGLTLGIASVTPLEMADAYATIANGGTHYDPECIERIVDSSGNVLVDNANPQGERVLEPEIAHAATEIMEGVITGGTGTAARLSNGQVAAGKTGTTDDQKDSWFCGITPQYSVAIWLGERAEYYADAHPVYATAASTFADFLNVVLADQPLEDFPDADEPEYLDKYVDEENHIGGAYKEDDEEDEEEESSSSSAGSSAGTSASSSSSHSSSGGTTAPPTPPTGGGGSSSSGSSSGGGGGGSSSGGSGAGGGGEDVEALAGPTT